MDRNRSQNMHSNAVIEQDENVISEDDELSPEI